MLYTWSEETWRRKRTNSELSELLNRPDRGCAWNRKSDFMREEQPSISDRSRGMEMAFPREGSCYKGEK